MTAAGTPPLHAVIDQNHHPPPAGSSGRAAFVLSQAATSIVDACRIVARSFGETI